MLPVRHESIQSSVGDIGAFSPKPKPLPGFKGRISRSKSYAAVTRATQLSKVLAAKLLFCILGTNSVRPEGVSPPPFRFSPRTA